jgi:hypothetical protein
MNHHIDNSSVEGYYIIDLTCEANVPSGGPSAPADAFTLIILDFISLNSPHFPRDNPQPTYLVRSCIETADFRATAIVKVATAVPTFIGAVRIGAPFFDAGGISHSPGPATL